MAKPVFCSLYRIHLATFTSCIHVLFGRNGHLKPWREVHFHMVFAAVWMMFFATLDLACGMRLNMRVFLVLRGDTNDDFSDLAYWVNILKLVTFVAQVFMGDCILLHRCWVVYGKNFWVIFIPALMTLAETACGSYATYLETTFQNQDIFITSANFTPWLLAMTSLTVAMNVITTSLIIARIWLIVSSTRQLSPHRTKSPLYSAMRILLDSGLIYTATAFIFLGTYVASSNASYLVSDCMTQIVGITFNLIIIRIGRGMATLSSPDVTSVRFATNLSEQV